MSFQCSHSVMSSNWQNGGVEGGVFIFSCENSRTTTWCWITIDRRMLDPTKKDIPHPRVMEMPQQDGGRGKLTFRIKPHTYQRWSEGSDKALWCNRRPHRDWARHAFEYLSVSCGVTGQQWPTAGVGTLGAAFLDVP